MTVFGMLSWLSFGPGGNERGIPGNNAARCAIAMQQGMVLVNQKWQARGLNEVSMRIGIHQDKAVVGNLGSKQRADYIVMSPGVNLASRIETACEVVKVYVSQSINQLLPD